MGRQRRGKGEEKQVERMRIEEREWSKRLIQKRNEESNKWEMRKERSDCVEGLEGKNEGKKIAG